MESGSNINGDQNALIGGENYSPFKPPNEEQVFITREAEKQRKKEQKEAAKHLKIWDKKTATSRMPLKRVKDGDIPPLQSDEGSHNFNGVQKGIIGVAVQIARSRVQFPREQRPQNISEFIDQKKEMFLVDLSYNTIKEEIKDIDLKMNRKGHALQDSTTQLDKDSAKLIQFIESDNLTTNERTKAAEEAVMERKAAESKINELKAKIQNFRSDIDKNVDTLSALETHKEFLYKIFEKENKNWVEEQRTRKAQKLQRIKFDWIERNKLHKDQFMDDEFFLNEDRDVSKPKGGKPQQPDNYMSDQWWSDQFDKRLKQDLIEVPDDFYEETVLYDDPEQLMDVFKDLEDQNLAKILKTQDTETQLEATKQNEIKTRATIGMEIEFQQQAKREIEARIEADTRTLLDLIKKSKMSSQATGGPGSKKKKPEEEDDEPDIDRLMDDIRREIVRVYSYLGDTSTLDAKSAVQILGDIEIALNEYMKLIKYVYISKEDKDGHMKGDYFKDIVVGLEKERKNLKQLESKAAKEKKEAEETAKNQQMMKERMNKKVKKIGKMKMTRSEKPQLEKKEVVKEVDEDTADQLLYLGYDLKSVALAGQGDEKK